MAFRNFMILFNKIIIPRHPAAASLAEMAALGLIPIAADASPKVSITDHVKSHIESHKSAGPEYNQKFFATMVEILRPDLNVTEETGRQLAESYLQRCSFSEISRILGIPYPGAHFDFSFSFLHVTFFITPTELQFSFYILLFGVHFSIGVAPVPLLPLSPKQAPKYDSFNFVVEFYALICDFENHRCRCVAHSRGRGPEDWRSGPELFYLRAFESLREGSPAKVCIWFRKKRLRRWKFGGNSHLSTRCPNLLFLEILVSNFCV